MKRRGISKGTVFPFSSCKCTVILQLERESLTESGAARCRGVEEEGDEGCITAFSWNKDSLSCRNKNVFVYVYGEELFVASMSGIQMWRHSAWWCGATVCLNRHYLTQILWITQSKCHVKFSRLLMSFFFFFSLSFWFSTPITQVGSSMAEVVACFMCSPLHLADH